MKPWTIVCFLLFLSIVVLGLLQMWFPTWSPDTFAKVIITDIALFVVSFVLAFLIKETKANDKIDNGSSLD